MKNEISRLKKPIALQSIIWPASVIERRVIGKKIRVRKKRLLLLLSETQIPLLRPLKQVASFVSFVDATLRWEAPNFETGLDVIFQVFNCNSISFINSRSENWLLSYFN